MMHYSSPIEKLAFVSFEEFNNTLLKYHETVHQRIVNWKEKMEKVECNFEAVLLKKLYLKYCLEISQCEGYETGSLIYGSFKFEFNTSTIFKYLLKNFQTM